MRAAAVACAIEEAEALAAVRAQPLMDGRSLVSAVSTEEPYVFSTSGGARVAVVDYGCKRSILRRLGRAGTQVTVYPSSVDADELCDYDGVLLSNGPGDPQPLRDEVAEVERLLGRVLVTSQNHGFGVTPTDAEEATHLSLYDGTVEGFSFPALRAESVQFHPEAGPGPHDAWPILERWIEELHDA